MHSYREWVVAVFAGATLICAQAQQNRFTVKDSIAMQRFMDPDPDTSGRVTSFSPDGRFFVVVTQHGLLKENLIESTIWLFDAGAVRGFALHPKDESLVVPKVLARFKGVNVTEPGDGPATVRDLRWSRDGRSLYFLGRENTAKWHLYRAAVASKQIVRLTPVEQNIANFDFVGDRIAYAVALPCPLYPRSRVMVATGLPLHALIDTRRMTGCPNSNELWVAEGGHIHPVTDYMTKQTERINTHSGDPMLAMSPNGRYVIVAQAVTEVPKKWEQYGQSAGTVRIAAVSPERLKLASDIDAPEKMVLVDLKTGANFIPVDAPLGRDAGYIGPTKASWSPDGKSVMLANLMLPLDGGTDTERHTRLSAAYVVLLDMQTRSWTPVARLKSNGPDDMHGWWPESIETDWLHSEVIIRYSVHGPTPEAYRLDNGQLVKTTAPGQMANETDASPVEVSVRQDLNTPPALFVKLIGSGGYAQIWDPNPQFHNIVFGHAEAYSWKDATGREVRGVLIKPPDFQTNRQYPLVIEARSYRQDQFEVDGTYATAVAAQAMAGSGLMVLQSGEPAVPRGESFRKGTTSALEGYKAAIAKLAGDGLVDSQRVGIIGFSRTCDNVMYAVTQAPNLFAAATIANGFTYGVMGYLETVDDTTDNGAMHQWWQHYGGNPLGDALGTFERENVLFNLHRVTTPVRVETHNPSFILTDWETYAGLRSLNKPVDLVVLPYATHVVSMPADVFESQQGDLDWFRFWLQGYEGSPNPEDPNQYKRWEHLRDLADKDAKLQKPEQETAVPQK
jgi:dipeptidyl aminopeptidase/acylaminoacyl peptidase